MTKKIALFGIIAFVALSLTGCGSDVQTQAATPPCKLNFNVKSIDITGDQDHYLDRAIRTELYKHGVKPTADGIEIVGNVSWDQGYPPKTLSIEVPTLAYAAAEYNSVFFGYNTESVGKGAKALAEDAVASFCTSAAVKKNGEPINNSADKNNK
jgi:hypothetical protein